MSSLSELEACLSILPSALPAPGSTINTTIFGVVFTLVVAVGIIDYASPLRLTRVLVTAIANLEKTYLEALETGLLSASDIDTAEMLSALQLKVSKIREASLRNSLSLLPTLREFFEGHTFTLLRCIREIFKESQLREDNLHPFANRVRSYHSVNLINFTAQIALDVHKPAVKRITLVIYQCTIGGKRVRAVKVAVGIHGTEMHYLHVDRRTEGDVVQIRRESHAVRVGSFQQAPLNNVLAVVGAHSLPIGKPTAAAQHH
ncbi:hypothetical protein B0H13DRAFT_1857619 [Mycena leptocephala]|nr:hypothetical protein B0H13DRAFT_1857619 [Mycena leptocephala]